MSVWKIPSPSSWTRRAISLNKGRKIWKCFVSMKFPSQHSCSVRTLLSPWARDAKYISKQSTHFNRAFPSQNLLLCRQLLWVAELVWTLLRIHSFPFAFSTAQILFRDKPWSWRVEQGTLEQDYPGHRLVLLWACLEKSESFTQAVPSDPLAVPLAEPSLFNGCTASSHYVGRNSWSFLLCFLI